MKSRSFGFYNAIHTFIVIAALAFTVAAQIGEWDAVLTPPEILEENKRTGEVTIFENRPDGSTRVTRTAYFPGTDNPRKQRVVTTINGSTKISSVNWNEQGEAIGYIEEMVPGTISYAESKDDINWQGKQTAGTRWFFRQAEDGSIVGDKVEQDLNPVTRKWLTRPPKQVITVNVFHHPSREADARKAESILTSGGSKVVLYPFPVVKESVESQRNISRIVYYYPAEVEADSRRIAKLLQPFATLNVFQEADPKLVDDKSGRSITLYLLDELFDKKPATPAPTPNAGNNSKDEIPRHESTIYAPYDSPGRDQIAAALERNYANAKKDVDRPEYDDNEATRLLREMESIFAFSEQQMLKEVPRSPRWQRFKDIKDRAGRDIRTLDERLKKSKPAGKKPLAGKWRLLVNGQPQAGEYTFDEFPENPIVNVKKDSKLWVNLVDLAAQKWLVSTTTNPDVPFTVGQNVELRGDAAAGRLEFWTKPIESDTFERSSYALVREEKSR